MTVTQDCLVSVCVITYNHEKFIKECLDSILSQKTNFNFCVLVSDDCSTDNTFSILKEYAEKYNNVYVQSRCGLPKSTYNGRPTGNMNFIENFKRANTKYISYCDGDDKWTNNDKLQYQVDYLEKNSDVALVCSAKNQIIDNELQLNKPIIGDIKFSYRWLYFYNPIPASSVTFRKLDFAEPPQWYFSEMDVGDWPLWFIVSKGKKIYRTQKPYLDYRVHALGLWSRKNSSDKVITYLNVIKHLQTLHKSLLLSFSYLLHYVRYLLTKSLESAAACIKRG